MILFKNIPVLLFFSLLIATTTANAEGTEITTPAAPTIAASGYILMNHDTGKVLAENNADVKLAPASLTKIMSVYVVFREISNGHLHLDDLVTISQKAWETPGSRMFVEVGKQVKVEDLLLGIIIQSGNDASVALAEHIAGNETTFADMMNQHAERLGMKNSHFQDSNGLPIDNHYTTARDLSILTRALIKEFPDYYRWFSQKEFTFNNIVQHNRNQLLSRDETVDGVKTGFTDAAGYCLVASALRNDMRLISVVMGASSPNARANENQNLLNYGFRFFEAHKLYQGKTSLSEARVWKGDTKNLQLGLAEDLYATIPRGHYADLKAVITIDKKITAPVKEGTKLGTVNVTLKDEVVANKDLIALKSVEQGNIIQRIYDSAMMMLEKSDAQ
ncbi:MAG: D-alanyl-D-alanine carboxypeptidase family protein [Methylobacter sp.]|uniref:D-alanyl-D-alanine carboxypeptidase family protein n=1 Tax=Methylobacter sp. TaxID=2051955 RepID=UPI00272FF9BC|nr:D-alanyl-D-alanine carboxypeptidase family protein [Methylobacter sp.]MDP1665817.1 D-alanyl-D-alanine carboxypeptidase family protein [Methylobacter sp.]MDP1971107.1 D-alanyl-D-alanine carboxypeptidase family protein [Methylobacter sp.]